MLIYHLTCFCAAHAINESRVKDVLCPCWKCSFCSSPWNKAWSAIPVTLRLYFCGIAPVSSVWGRDAQKGHEEGWSECINACFLLDPHNEYVTSDQKPDGGIPRAMPRGSEAASPYAPLFKAGKSNLKLFKTVIVSPRYFFLHIKGDIGWTAGNTTEPKRREHGAELSWPCSCSRLWKKSRQRWKTASSTDFCTSGITTASEL